MYQTVDELKKAHDKMTTRIELEVLEAKRAQYLIKFLVCSTPGLKIVYRAESMAEAIRKGYTDNPDFKVIRICQNYHVMQAINRVNGTTY